MLGTREFTDQTKPQVMRLGLHWLWASFHKGNSRKIWTGRGQSMWHPKEKLVFPLTWPTRSQGSRRRSCSAQGLQGCSSAQVELSPLAEVCLQVHPESLRKQCSREHSWLLSPEEKPLQTLCPSKQCLHSRGLQKASQPALVIHCCLNGSVIFAHLLGQRSSERAGSCPKS